MDARFAVAGVVLATGSPATAVADEHPAGHRSAAVREMRSDAIERFGAAKARRYRHLHTWAVHAFGKKTVGRDVVLFGMPEPGPGHRLPTRREFAETYNRLITWRHPPPPPAPAVATSQPTSQPAASSATASSQGGGFASSSTVQCESSGDYSANTGNGYYGGYQFDSHTWDRFGDPAYEEANEAPPAVQDAAAARVTYDAWPNC
jgi:hypothetical protein